ncbi:MAG: ABC transporter ATP-binding protein [Phycisphaerales bacterium]|nr:ABC transporter ATP-binding protein [Phycisphaerales bacterium]
MTAITLDGVRKAFGSTVAVDSVSLRIADGHLFFLLGPSGCGKTTLLRMIAGFIVPGRGTIRFDDQDVTRLPPEKRQTGMVFQNYALWPHMSVFENVAFGLKVRKVSRGERDDRVAAALKAVRMQDYAKRTPNQLSGGQQQRVALARALVIEPKVLLLDEPLSNLDARLRSEMRREIRRLCSETGITTVYVTHDQVEALSMADELAVLRDGRVMQVGKPRDVYQRPDNRFVADFLGDTNFISAEVVGAEAGELILHAPMGNVRARGLHEDTPRSGNLTCSIRPEAWRLGAAAGNGAAGNQWQGTIVDSVYHGEAARHEIELAGDVTIHALELNPQQRQPGAQVEVSIDPGDVVVLAD